MDRQPIIFADRAQDYIHVSRHKTLAEAVDAASLKAKQATEQDKTENKTGGAQIILLSPAAASFDQFANFEARGDAFCHYAQQQIATWEQAAIPNNKTPEVPPHV